MTSPRSEWVPSGSPSGSRVGSEAPRDNTSERVQWVPPLIPPLGGPAGPTQRVPATTDNTSGSRRDPHPSDNGRSTWLLTPRSAPAWIAVRHLLDDNQWHPTTDVAQAMRDAADLAPQTIRNQINAAGRRRWIQRRKGRIRLRNVALFDAALDTLDGVA